MVQRTRNICRINKWAENKVQRTEIFKVILHNYLKWTIYCRPNCLAFEIVSFNYA